MHGSKKSLQAHKNNNKKLTERQECSWHGAKQELGEILRLGSQHILIQAVFLGRTHYDVLVAAVEAQDISLTTGSATVVLNDATYFISTGFVLVIITILRFLGVATTSRVCR